MKQISFRFEGKEYTVGMEACDKDTLIRLPDGRILEVEGWYECYPPKPVLLKVIDCIDATEVK